MNRAPRETVLSFSATNRGEAQGRTVDSRPSLGALDISRSRDAVAAIEVPESVKGRDNSAPASCYHEWESGTWGVILGASRCKRCGKVADASDFHVTRSERIAGLLRRHVQRTLLVAFPGRRANGVPGFPDVSQHATERD